MGKQWKQWQIIFLGSKITADGDCSYEIKTCLLLGRKAMTSVDSALKSRDITLLTKVHIVKAMIFFSSHAWMWELGHKEGWVLKNWCFLIVVLEKTPEKSLGLQDQTSQSWRISTLNIHWKDWCWSWSSNPCPCDSKSQLIGKDPDVGKDWGRQKQVTEDKMAGQHYWVNGHELEQTPGDSEGQGSLVCCSPWGCRVGHNLVTEQQLSKHCFAAFHKLGSFSFIFI